MAQPNGGISAVVWMEGDESTGIVKPVGKYLESVFTGNGGAIATALQQENGKTKIVKVWDMLISDYITDPDERRLGLFGEPDPALPRAYLGTSTYGEFQSVRFNVREYTLSRRRSTAVRIWENILFDGGVGEWGDATHSNANTTGQNFLPVAAQISRYFEKWRDEIAGPDFEKYALSAICQGRMNGLYVADNPNVIFDGNGTWVAEPGEYQGTAIPPRFAPIHCVEWDGTNIPLLLNNTEVTWTNLRVDTTKKTCIMDPYYQYDFIAALTGRGIAVTEAAFNMLEAGKFTQLMGWRFNFAIPSQYWPQLYVDGNLNVVHSATGTAPYDQFINSIADDGTYMSLQRQLVESDRMIRTNYVRTMWTGTEYKTTVTNYPLGQPSASPYLGVPKAAEFDWFGAVESKSPYGDFAPDQPGSVAGAGQQYPYMNLGSGFGPAEWTGPQGPIIRRQVVGMFLIPDAAQLSQEASFMYTDTRPIAGAFTEAVVELKQDAWVYEGKSMCIIPILDAKGPHNVNPGIPVVMLDGPGEATKLTLFDVSPKTLSLEVGTMSGVTVAVAGTGQYDTGWTAVSGNAAVASIEENGLIRALSVGTSIITFTPMEKNVAAGVGNVTVTVTVTAA